MAGRFFHRVLCRALCLYPATLFATSVLGAPDAGIDGGPLTLRPEMQHEVQRDSFGRSVAISDDGTVLVIGASTESYDEDEKGAAYVFILDEDGWGQEVRLIDPAGSALDRFGFAVAISGDGKQILVASFAFSDLEERSGSVDSFGLTSVGWVHQQKLQPDIEVRDGAFGRAIALNQDGSIAVVTTDFDDAAGFKAGSASVFQRDGAEWTLQQRLFSEPAVEGAEFGTSVALSGDESRMLISATGWQEDGDDVGALFVFEPTDDGWVQSDFIVPGAQWDRRFGWAVALNEDGSVGLASTREFGRGSVRFYGFHDDGWVEQAFFRGETTNQLFGLSVSLDSVGRRAIIGAPGDDELDFFAGAAFSYVYTPDGWLRERKLLANAPGDIGETGFAVAITDDGTSAVVGAPFTYGPGRSFVFAFPSLAVDAGVEMPDGGADGGPVVIDDVPQWTCGCSGSTEPNRTKSLGAVVILVGLLLRLRRTRPRRRRRPDESAERA